ncbi:MAG: alpha/beta hydrolase-fold protein [Acholeplasmataceae bacterium]|nr:alpha/beta hydrolase [Acholeplasmataceae bacterium]
MHELIIIKKYSNLLDKEMTIRILVPKNVQQLKKTFPVLYMHDGQNLFEDQTATYGFSWQIQTTMDNMVSKRTIKDMIIVGIDSDEDRLNMYSPWKNNPKYTSKLNQTYGGKGDLYIDWLVSELKPWIDQTYPTKKEKIHTYIAGSSMGSYISLYAMCKYPDVFSSAGLFSTSLWFHENPMIDYLRSSFLSASHRVFISVGTMEANPDPNDSSNASYIQGSKKIASILSDLGVKHIKLVIVNEKHHEQAWSHQFIDFLNYLNQR